MADLIAQGSEDQQRWRRPLTVGERVVVGRESGPWSTPWDNHISRLHAELTYRNGRLSVRRLPSGLNPVSFSTTSLDVVVCSDTQLSPTASERSAP